MSYAITSDRERQEDEMIVLSSIYCENEFVCSRDKQIKCTINIFPKLTKKLEIKFANHYSNAISNTVGSYNKILIEHLPPIKLYIQLPDMYPSRKSPNFSLSIIWLTPWETSVVCQKLDEIWEENQGSEILFLWLDFLQNDFFSFLGIRDLLDVSFIYKAHTTPDDYVYQAHLSDPRVINGSLSTNIIKVLISYNSQQHRKQFKKNHYTCLICFDEYSGQNCIELKNCGHIYCKNCIEKHISIKIKENVKIISCPMLECSNEINYNDVKKLCPTWFLQYEKLVLRLALDIMDDVIYCPRVSCQYPVIREPNDTSPICPICHFCFCIYCYKMYHGVAPCEMTSDDIKELINDYKNSSDKKKNMLEKKFGRRRMQLIENQLTTEYIHDNTKRCPKCHSVISKIDGCNKMICSYCQSNFCWLCGQHITSENAYDHFMDVNNPCYRRLLDGVDHLIY